ncbi:MAG: glycosyl transferase family 2 [Bacteroidetes bacterium]|nr:MAG: glycosyl transferase family 2 [Bacteroidota bacterium]
MLSICIPIYNCDVTELVGNLLTQIEENTVPAEIILIDDTSEVEFQKLNKMLSELDSVSYVQLEKNIGRAKIRNLFLSYTNFDYLLFLDCDSQILNAKFIENYLAQIVKEQKVVCGGRTYPVVLPPETHYLRWKYGLERECLPANRRGQKPHQSFMTNNFLIQARVLTQISFDERITEYGHEDTLFGYRLKQSNIPVTHINNPVQHLYTESNVEFLKKTELGLKNLIKIRKFVDNKDFDNEIKLLRVYRKASRFGLKHVLSFAYILTGTLILRLLKNNTGGIYLFDLYKLLFLSKQIK